MYEHEFRVMGLRFFAALFFDGWGRVHFFLNGGWECVRLFLGRGPLLFLSFQRGTLSLSSLMEIMMFEEQRIAVIMPAYNEASQLGGVVATMPSCVDTIFIVDDASTDDTADVARKLAEGDVRVRLIVRSANGGVGAAIEDGYRASYESGHDIAVVMAGDGQMDPADLPALLTPVARGEVDYAKGNRLLVGDAWKVIPRQRFLGNAVLSVLTKIASGYWHVADSQSGYTAINRAALGALLPYGIYPRYGMPNDVLVKLNVHRMRVCDVSIRPVYHVGEKSKMCIPRVVGPIAFLLVRLFLWRLWAKYTVRDTHPLVLFYLAGITLFPLGLCHVVFVALVRVVLPLMLDPGGGVLSVLRMAATGNALVLGVTVMLTGLQMLLFAMWFDMADNQKQCIRG